MTSRRADDLRSALLAETLDEVARLHEVIQAIEPQFDAWAAAAKTAIEEATARAQAELERTAEAQAQWLEQETLKDRQAFLAQLQEAFDSWTGEVQALVEGQEATLRRVVVQTVQVLQEQRAAGAATRQRRQGIGWGAVALVGLAGAVVGAGISTLALALGWLTGA